MKILLRAWVFGLLALPVVPSIVWAETDTGSIGIILATDLYCGTISLIEGYLGLLLGLLLVFFGIWGLIRGAKWQVAVPSILLGALITAIPSMIESVISGVGALLEEAKLIASADVYEPPNCSDTVHGRIPPPDGYVTGMDSGGLPYR